MDLFSNEWRCLVNGAINAHCILHRLTYTWLRYGLPKSSIFAIKIKANGSLLSICRTKSSKNKAKNMFGFRFQSIAHFIFCFCFAVLISKKLFLYYFVFVLQLRPIKSIFVHFLHLLFLLEKDPTFFPSGCRNCY